MGSFPKGASPYGLLDMTGNAREWTDSALRPYPLTDPTGGTEGATSRVTRGGSWLSLPNSIEVTRRLAEPVDHSSEGPRLPLRRLGRPGDEEVTADQHGTPCLRETPAGRGTNSARRQPRRDHVS